MTAQLKTTALIIYSALILLISGCGFQLRHNVDLPSSLHTIKILPDEQYDPLQKRIRRQLQRKGIVLANPSTKNVVTLNINNQNFNEAIVGYDSNSQPQRIRLSLSIFYTIHNKNNSLINREPIMVAREFNIDPSNMLNNESERHLQRTELIQEATVQLLHALSSLDDSQISENKK